jgi:hypothetical protein
MTRNGLSREETAKVERNWQSVHGGKNKRIGGKDAPGVLSMRTFRAEERKVVIKG